MIRTKLMGHQALATEFCTVTNTLPYSGIFADYGTGKTLIALAITEIMKFRKVLVVSTDLSIKTTWRNEIRKHSDFRFCVLKGTAKARVNALTYAVGLVENPDRYGEPTRATHKPMIFLINYEGVKSICGELASIGFDAIFADESTKLKTHNRERTMALYAVGERVRHKYIMTGFPITEGLIELYSQIKFLDRGATFGTSYYAFVNRHFVRMGRKLVAKKRAVEQILNAIKPFCIRITNEHLKLPPKVCKEIKIEMTDQQKHLLSELNNTFRLELGKVKVDTKYVFTLIAKSLQICDGFIQSAEYELDSEGNKTNKVVSSDLEVIETGKDEALLEILQEIDVRKNKVVIWAAFLFTVEKIKRILEKFGIEVLTLTGETEDPSNVVDLFQNDSRYNVIIATQKKAAESVTLTSSRFAIYYSRLWSYDLRGNSEARIRRKGSEIHESIVYIDLITEGTVEENVFACLLKKKDLVDELKTAFLKMNG